MYMHMSKDTKRMEVIHKIEIAAMGSPDNAEEISLIKSLSRSVIVTLNSACDRAKDQKFFVTLDSSEVLHNKERFALILSEGGMSYPTSGIRSVSVEWTSDKHNSKTLKGKLLVELSDDDACYDHILTDVRNNDRSIPVPEGRYSTCSCVSNGTLYYDSYITIHTKTL